MDNLVESKVSVPVIILGPKRRTAPVTGLLPLGLLGLLLVLLLHIVGCPCWRTPWLARGPSVLGLLLVLLLVLLLLLHIVGCPCRRTPWLSRNPGGLLLLNPSEDVVPLGDSGCRFADRGRGDAVEELRKAWRARSMKDSMLSLS